MSPEVASQIATWRARAAEGELTVDEMRKVVELVRGDRKTASLSAATAKKVKAKKEVKSADDLLKELGL